MLKSKTFVICSVVFLLTAVPVNAHAVELLADDRKVQQFSDKTNETATPDTPFSDFNVSYQNTVVSNTEFSGSGSGFGESDFSFFIAESTFDITFGVNAETDIDLSGNFSVFPGDFGFSEVTVRLYDGADTATANIVYSDSIETSFGFEEGSFLFNQTLAAGTYRLVIKTNITPGGFDTNADFNFSTIFTELFSDNDGDGVNDSADNCFLVANSDQVDTDNDGYGNACDADFNNDCVVNFIDIGAFADEFLGTNALFDLNGDGAVNFLDYTTLTNQFLQTPGPGLASGLCED
ncbi:MAG: thrombospondin type 3 repeat-containing protein [Gammaproteobacteria bacterium]